MYFEWELVGLLYPLNLKRTMDLHTITIQEVITANTLSGQNAIATFLYKAPTRLKVYSAVKF